MTEIATLGIKVDTTGVNAAVTALDKLAPAAARAERGAEGLAKAAGHAQGALGRFVKASDDAGASTGRALTNHEKLARVLAEAERAMAKYQRTTNSTNDSLGKTGDAAAKGAEKFSKGAGAAAKGAEGLAKSAGLARHELINLSRQVQDVGVSLGSGQSPMMVLMQQGTQIGDIFASSKGTLRGFGSQLASMITPTRALGLGLGVVGAAAYAAWQHWKGFALQLDDAARAAGTTSREMNKLYGAASSKGIDRNEFFDGMAKFSSQVYQAKNGMGDLATVLRANGMRAQEFGGHMEAAAELIKNAGSDQQRLVLLQQMGLPATMQWVRLLSQGAEGFRRAKDAQSELAKGQDEMVRKQRELDDAWNTFWTNRGQEFRNFFVTVISGIKSIGTELSKAYNKGLPPQGTRLRIDGPANESEGGKGGTTVDPAVLAANIAKMQQRIGLLGQMATVEQQVLAVQLQVQAARLAGIQISDRESAALQQLAREQALGITAIRQQTDAYTIQNGAMGRAIGDAAAYVMVQNAIADAIRRRAPLNAAQIKQIEAEAAALAKVVQQNAQLSANKRAQFDVDTAFLSPEELRIAQEMQNIFGDKWKANMDSALADMMRFADSLRTIKSVAGNAFSEFISGLQQGKSLANSMRDSIASLGKKLVEIGSTKLFEAGFDALSGMLKGAGFGASLIAASTTAAAQLTAAGASAGAALATGGTVAGSAITVGSTTGAAAQVTGGTAAGGMTAAGGVTAGAALAAGGTTAGTALWGPIAALGAVIAGIGMTLFGGSGDKRRQAVIDQYNRDVSVVDRTFAATHDSGSRYDEMVLLERKFENERIQEMIRGGQGMAELIQAQNAERLKFERDWAEKSLKQRLDYDDRIFAATNDTSTLAGALADFDRSAFRELEDAKRESNENIASLEMALSAERLKIIRDFAAEAAEEESRRAKEAQQERLRQAQEQLQNARSELASAQSALNSAYEAAKQPLDDVISRMTQFRDTFKRLKDSLLLNPSYSPLSAQDQYLEAQRQYRATRALAATGDETALERLQNDLQAYLDQSRSYNASTEAYYNDFQETQADLASMDDALSRIQSDAQQQLAVLNQQVAGLITINSSVMSVEAAINNLTLAQQNVAAAMANLNNARNWGTRPEINRMLVDGLQARGVSYTGNFGDGEFGAWRATQSQSVNDIIAEIERSIPQSLIDFYARQNKVAPFQPAYANGTSYAVGGLSLVGEQGPELMQVPRGARITPAGETRSMLASAGNDNNSAAVVALLSTVAGRLSKIEQAVWGSGNHVRAGVDGLATKQSQDGAAARQQSRKPNSYGTGQKAA